MAAQVASAFGGGLSLAGALEEPLTCECGRWADRRRYVAAMAPHRARLALRGAAGAGFLTLIRPVRLIAEHGAGLWADR
jgi:hypothetical protein